MTQSAINILSKDPDGFFLMIEGGQIDWAGHANDAANAIQDTLGLDEAVAVGQLYAQAHPDTLIIVTADHETGGMTPGLQTGGMPGEDGPFFMPDGTPFFVNWSTTAHTGVDVPISAQGPWAHLLNATQENTHIHAVMHAAFVGASFTDVLPDHWSWPYVEALAAAGLTAGCGGGRFCPDDEVGRDQVAVFLERAIRGAGFNPPPARSIFSDVPDDHWAAGWIEQLAADGLTAGCGGGDYCPAMAVTRSQMSILLERAQFWPSTYIPPPATGLVFDDVPPDHWAGAWIEQLAADGITAGCSEDPPLFCSEVPVTRAEMAVFVVKAFELPLP